ncbi:MAG: glycosyltransferase [Acidimicrobiia bacterium]|nr:glycosyltransferase [Acidimicrobiia bacterium]
MEGELEPHRRYFQEGNNHLSQGRVQESIASYRQSLARKQDFRVARSNLLLALQYDDCSSPEAVAGEHRWWGARMEANWRGCCRHHTNEADPERRLKVGYVSGDFCRHPVCYFLEPLLDGHDREQFQIFCYDNVAKPDSFTERLRGKACVWRRIRNQPDEDALRQMQADGIDILVDLSGHTRANRLEIFARKPAPVQVTYLGYPCTTGLTAIDYRLTDHATDPVGLTGHLFTEKLERIGGSQFCYRPVEDYPEVGQPAGGPITFGAFHRQAKLNGGVIAAWSQILHRVEGARLLLHYGVAQQDAEKERELEQRWAAELAAQFGAHGIGEERLRVVGRRKRKQHWELYREVDVALDPFPYNGATATCEALWMGVPVITLSGRTHASRLGVGILTQTGLEECIAGSREEYVEMAVRIAREQDWRAAVRGGLRDRFAQRMMDGGRTAAQVEAAYRRMWINWCAARKPVDGRNRQQAGADTAAGR